MMVLFIRMNVVLQSIAATLVMSGTLGYSATIVINGFIWNVLDSLTEQQVEKKTSFIAAALNR